MFKLQKPNALIEILKRKETISVLIIVVFLVGALASVFVSPQLSKWTIHEGDISLKNVYAPYDFEYAWGIDEGKTEEAQKKVKEKVPYTFLLNLAAEETMGADIQGFFDVLEEAGNTDLTMVEKVEYLKKEDNSNGVSDKNLKAFLGYIEPLSLGKKTQNVLRKVFQEGYISNDDLRYLEENDIREVVLFDQEKNTGIESARANLLTEANLAGSVEKLAKTQFETDKKTRQVVTQLILSKVVPNLIRDQKRTEQKRDEATKGVKPIYKKWKVRKNELIIAKGTKVNARHIAQLTQLRRVFRPGTTPTFFIGMLLLFLLLGAVGVIYTKMIRKRHLLGEVKTISVIFINLFIVIIIADFIAKSPQPSHFIPMAGMGMLLTLLVGFNLAFICVVVMSILIALLISGGVEIVLVLLVGSIVGMFVVSGARLRSKILWAGLMAGVAKCIAIICIGLINRMAMDVYVKDGIWGIASGVFSGFIVMGLLPVFEHIFKVPTNISLLELSDLNHPLLKELALEAPGTYHHSIMVGNLAEAACDAIGANSLRARVGAYYHDIGKIPNAEYFSENELGSGSRHTNLAPSMSALIISKHVKKGAEIAKKYKLSNTIVDFITQHHGNSLIAYFYQKAMEKTEQGDAPLKEEDFRYPGPRPQTKEGAIILLADSVEASSRALDEPTPSSIRNLVRKIINNKFIDGQLDECDLTLRDMHKIAESFVRVLTGIFHTRLTYPDNLL